MRRPPARALRPISRRITRALFVVAILTLAIVIVSFIWARTNLRASLPLLDGTRTLPGLTAEVTVTRDGLGVPTIRGRSREDVARATGFLHGQDRFFQMDLSRRRAAGELAALVGARAAPVDMEIRIHRFRATAREALTHMHPSDRAFLDAYAAGVNSGLSSLGAAPFEYFLLRQDPAPWLAEDSLLVVLSMFITLQDATGTYESTLGTIHDVLPPEMAAFMVPRGSEWDAPIVGAAFGVPPIPGPEIYNLRARRVGKPGIERPSARPQETVELPTSNLQLPRVIATFLGFGSWELGVDGGAEGALGSNNWVVSGRLTQDGGPLVANDMHLTVRVPNTWYRATLEWPDSSNPAEWHQLSGVTLPGVPALVVGSNRRVAWGFTNTYGDWGDIVLLDIDPSNPDRYRTPDGWREFVRHQEAIRVAGEDEIQQTVVWTIWGPVLPRDHRGRDRAYSWVAHSAQRLAAPIMRLENARNVVEAFDAANSMGVPGQNIVAADREGHIGWSVFGGIPRRVGLDGALPQFWHSGDKGWKGFLDVPEYPRVIDPSGGRIWTANARVVDGDMLAKIGDNGYEIGSRATIIRKRLMEKDRFVPRDLLDVQLDASSRFLERWRTLLLQTLTPAVVAASRERARLREIVEREWTGQASPESAAYRLTRNFREQVSDRVLAFVLVECYEADAEFVHTTLRRREAPVWKLVSERPVHLLDPQFATWDDLFSDAIDEVLERAGGDLADRTWYEFNVTAYRHPLSASIPFLGRWLDMPRHPLPGDLYTPRVHWGAAAASVRMIVSPGREASGILHMPSGQSGHPLSPFYANSHDAWVRGEPTPFYPGAARHRLTLGP
jgi:penicillin amidase